jgi:Xaa-Pro aminopeptidase
MPKIASSLSFGIGAIDWQDRIDMTRMVKERAERLRLTMRKHNVAACLISRSDNIRYAVGVPGPDFVPQLRYCLFSVEHDPILWEHTVYFQVRQQEVPQIKPENWRLARSWLGGICGPAASEEEARLFASEIFQELRQKGLTGEKLGVTGLDGEALAALHELKIETFDFWPIMLEARAVKTPDEINCLKMAVAIGDVAWWEVYETIRPGIRDRDIVATAAAAIHRTSQETGTAYMTTWSGPNTFPRGHHGTDRIIQFGDIVYGDMHANYLGYQS